ncbi:MAG TPA: DUF1080 domain-containing protein, partial [Myxococcales bacterium]
MCRHGWILSTLLLLLASGGAFCATPGNGSEDPSAGWIRLFDGTSRFGWVAGAGNWQVSDVALVSDGTGAARIYTDLPFADFTLRFEARVTGGSANVVVRLDPDSKPAQPGIHLGLTDGSVDGQHGNAALAAGAQGWRQIEIRADGDQLSATINGMPVAAETDAKNR